MPTASTGIERLRVLVEHADFDDVVLQNILRAMQDVGSQQLDSLFDGHLRDFVGREVGQLDAGLVNRGELLLLQDFVGHFANRDDQMLRRAFGIDHRGGVNSHVAVLETAQASSRSGGRWRARCGTDRSRARESRACPSLRKSSSRRRLRGRSIRAGGRCPKGLCCRRRAARRRRACLAARARFERAGRR